MKLLQKLHTLLEKSHMSRFLIGTFTLVVLVNIVFVIGHASYNATVDLTNRLTPRSEYFDYQGIGYKGREGNTLVFISTSIVKQSYPILYNDILRCENGDSYSFYSRQETSAAAREPYTKYRQIKWNYNEPFPIGKRCYLESTIIMTVGGHPKVQKYDGLANGKEFVIR